MIQVYNNFLPDDLFLELSEMITDDKTMQWNFIDNCSAVYDENFKNEYLRNQYGFYHLIFDNFPCSLLFNNFSKIIDCMANDYKIDILNIRRMRLGMQTKVRDENVIHTPHIDLMKPHKVLLMYFNESDGDTIFYDNNNVIFKKISPEPNKAVIFDGLISHSSSTPKLYQRRIALNVNFNIEEK